MHVAEAAVAGYVERERAGVTGSDTQGADGRVAPVPLSTVRQSIYGLGYTGVELLLRRIHGEAVPDSVAPFGAAEGVLRATFRGSDVVGRSGRHAHRRYAHLVAGALYPR